MDAVARLLAELESGPADSRSVAHWQPPCCGRIDIRIDRDGLWYHEGAPFQRPSLVRLLAGLLRRDPDGYCLVTPSEKWLLRVDDVPFVASLEQVVAAGTVGQQVFLRTNVGDRLRVDAASPLQMRGPAADRRPYVAVRSGLEARLLSAAFYQLAEHACQWQGRWGVFSAGHFCLLE